MNQENATPFTNKLHFYTSLFEGLSCNSYLIEPNAPTFTILAATAEIMLLSGLEREDVIGKGIFESFPSNPEDPNDTGEINLRASFEVVLKNKTKHQLPIQRYDVVDSNGEFAERYWQAENKPVLDPAGEVLYIIHTTKDITDQVSNLNIKEQLKSLETVRNLFLQTPVPIQIYKGEDLVIELANDPTLEVWGKDKSIIGKPLIEALPEIAGKEYIDMLHEVMQTGKTKYLFDVPAMFTVDGKERTGYYNSIYQPYYDDSTEKPNGVLVFGFDVTEKVLARQKAKESEAKYKALLEAMDQGFCVLELIFNDNGEPIDFRYVEINPAFEKQSGLKNAVGKTILQIVPGYEKIWIERYGKVVKTGEPVRVIDESKALQKWFDVHAFRLGGTGSTLIAVFFTDITERQVLSGSLKESEQRFHNLIKGASVGIVLLSGEALKVEVVNESYTKLIGRTAEDLFGKPIFDVIPEAETYYRSFINTVFETGEPVRLYDTPYEVASDGKLINGYLDVVYQPFRESDGKITGVMALCQDVTEQVKAKKGLEDSHKEFQFVTDFMPQMIWVTRPDGYHYYYNKQWYDYTGLTYGETKGDGWNHVFHPDDQDRAWKVWRHSLETGDPYEIEYRCRRYDGTYRWFLGRALPLKDESGAILKWFGTCTDIHDQKLVNDLMEQKVEERTIELMQVNEQLKQFTYAASHDLQEPLRKINFFLDRLTTNLGPTLDSENKIIADRILITVDRMRNLINDLLDYSNTTQGFTILEDVPLNEIVNDVLDDMEATIIENRAVMNIEDLPTIRGDRSQLRQMFLNIISNALKYRNKEIVPLIKVSSSIVAGKDTEYRLPEEGRKKMFHLIEIKDNGIGFDPEDSERIFRIFQRLHGKTEYQGTGVGLAIVQKVLENHNGYIWAEGESGKGASFNMLLPV